MTKTETFSGERAFPVAGYYFELLEVAAPVDVELLGAGERRLSFDQGVSAGFWVDLRGVALFETIKITTSGSQQVKFIYSSGTTGNRSIPADITDDAARLLGIVTVDTGPATIAAPVSVAVDDTVTPDQLIAAGDRRSVYFLNAGTDTVYLGGAGVTTDSPLRLAPGERVEIVGDAANAAWFGILDAAGSHAVKVMVVNAA